jgi:HEPN domain-containing protein
MKRITEKWVEFARQDLKDAEILFRQKSLRGCSWHCHQTIEKILKAIIIEKGKRPRKIHDLIELLKDTEIELPEELMKFVEELDLYYLPPRYPDIYEQMKKYYSLKNIQRVFKLTKILFLWLKNYLNQK